MIVCLIGPTCVGKTTTAQRLAGIVGWPLRSCGIAIRERATAVSTEVEHLGDADHRAVDGETVEWALKHRDCLVEGRFLDAVFHAAAVPVTKIGLVASLDARAERGRLRGKSTFAVDDVLRADREDALFRARFYALAPTPWALPVLDNSDLAVDECVHRVRAMMGEASL